MANLSGLPRPHLETYRKIYRSFSSSRSWDDTEWNWSQCDKIPRTSSFKYVWCKPRQIGALIQNGRLPVGLRSWLQETFLCVLSWCTSVPNFIVLGQSVGRAYAFELLLFSPKKRPLERPQWQKLTKLGALTHSAIPKKCITFRANRYTGSWETIFW